MKATKAIEDSCMLEKDLVTKHSSLVKSIAYRLLVRLPTNVQAGDLIQAGMISLLESWRNYDGTNGASFETYARIRIKGAMLDELRRTDWAPRSVHRKARQVAAAVCEIENRNGRKANASEVAEKLNITLREYTRIVNSASDCRMLSTDDIGKNGEDSFKIVAGSEVDNPFNQIQDLEFKASLSEAISLLPNREQLVVNLYYSEDFNFREIGAMFDLTESRICQIHKNALDRLQAWNRRFVNEENNEVD